MDRANRQAQSESRCWTRRGWLQCGGVAACLGLGQRLAVGADDNAAPGFGRAKSVIVVFASGGQSQLEMWDPKPLAPVEVRGEFSSIPTAIPGVRFGEHMPRIARIADKLCVVRTMSHEDLDHGSAFYLSMTGRYHSRRSSNPLPSPNDEPCYSAILKRVRPHSDFVQPAVHLNGPALVPVNVGPGQFGGLLGRQYDPMLLGDVTEEQAPVPDLGPLPDVSRARRERRRTLLESLEDAQREIGQHQKILDMSDFYRQAFRMIDRPATREAFRLDAEPQRIRERYGRHRSGQACLLARRLVEARVPLITVIWNHSNRGQDLHPDVTDEYGWDTHNDIFHALKNHLLPRFDVSFTALLEDLDERGLLDETLVVCMGEFGRAPLVALEPRFAGSSPGRKHWASAYSVVFAGAGVSRGRVVGQTDKSAAFPLEDRYGPWDITATIFSALGITPSDHYFDLNGKPTAISYGRPIEALYG